MGDQPTRLFDEAGRGDPPFGDSRRRGHRGGQGAGTLRAPDAPQQGQRH